MRKLRYEMPALKEIDLIREGAGGESEPPPPVPRRPDVWPDGIRQPGEWPWESWDEDD